MHYFKYFLQLLKHKYYVWVYGTRIAPKYWYRYALHDLSKLRPSEFGPHAVFFCKEGFKDSAAKERLDDAWNRHQKRNPHHFEYWLAIGRGGSLSPRPIPTPYLAEMAADWVARSKHRDNRSIQQMTKGMTKLIDPISYQVLLSFLRRGMK